jgi:hypothetical protein
VGVGNLQSISEPVRPGDAQFRFYDPKINLETDAQGGRYGGKKTFDYVMIPQKAGAISLPPFRLVFFDPMEGRYKTVDSRPVAMTVTPNANLSQPEVIANREEVRLIGQDIRYIKPDRTQLADQSLLMHHRKSYWFLQLLPVLGVLGAWAYRRHQDRLTGDVAYARRRRARAQARRCLAEAARLMQAKNATDFHAEVHRSVAQFLADRLNRSTAGLTTEAATRALRDKGVAQSQVEQVSQIFHQCDMARFAPGQATAEQMRGLYDKAASLIDDLERMI